MSGTREIQIWLQEARLFLGINPDQSWIDVWDEQGNVANLRISPSLMDRRGVRLAIEEALTVGRILGHKQGMAQIQDGIKKILGIKEGRFLESSIQEE